MSKYTFKNLKLSGPSAIKDAPYLAIFIFYSANAIMTYQLVHYLNWHDLGFMAPILICVLSFAGPIFMIRSQSSGDWFSKIFSALSIVFGFWFYAQEAGDQPRYFTYVLVASIIVSVLFFAFLFGKGGKKYHDRYFDETGGGGGYKEPDWKKNQRQHDFSNIQ